VLAGGREVAGAVVFGATIVRGGDCCANNSPDVITTAMTNSNAAREIIPENLFGMIATLNRATEQ
jgi:hypothetical protein